jgi:hypothetical protein
MSELLETEDTILCIKTQGVQVLPSVYVTMCDIVFGGNTFTHHGVKASLSTDLDTP